ncbi:MAG: lipopolysaccharide assembly protein LapB [Xanthomonadales bacterium]|nr:lipopolysaccharide assembly protein LapB [Xanthomonadales bacterium]HRD72738.1 lipopolysaccharide assembly protein LapB [Aquimonas sp.]
MEELSLLFLLLPVAALSGWWTGRRAALRSGGRRMTRLSSSYFRGLNYLLNEQPDKAIEVFLQIADIDRDTVETHFALGNLFRRRGEVERAIRIHQNLIERSSLSDEHRTLALLELGEDYMRAGLLDRAEILFSDLVKEGTLAPKALRHLISIYQQERDWENAIAHAGKLERATGEPMGRLIAQFECEIAEQQIAVGNWATARVHLRNAFGHEANSIRAGLIEARLAMANGDDVAAMRSYERVARHEPDIFIEVMRPLLDLYERLGERDRAHDFLREMIDRYAGVAPLLAKARMIQQELGAKAAGEFLLSELLERPSIKGQSALISLCMSEDASVSPEQAQRLLTGLGQINQRLVSSSPTYRCNRCGFAARAHHWQCPSCKSWASIKPIHNAAGE